MVRVVRSCIIDAPIDTVWEILRDFNDHDRWHPAVRVSRIEEGRAPSEIGCVRDFELTDGGVIREQLLSLSDKDFTLTYCVLDASVPLANYVATIKLRPVTDGDRTFWHWESRFDPPPGQELELAAMVGRDVYEGGFEAVRKLLTGAAHYRTPPRASSQPAAATAPHARTAYAQASGQAIKTKAIVVNAYGGPEVLTFRDAIAPPPGQASGPLLAAGVAAFSSKSATLSRPNFGHYTGTRADAGLSAGRLFRALRSGVIRVSPPQTFPLVQAAAAHRALESRRTTGSLVLLPASQ